jgi:hypothetical protein
MGIKEIGCGLDSAGTRSDPVTDSFEQRNGPSDSIKGSGEEGKTSFLFSTCHWSPYIARMWQQLCKYIICVSHVF